jgi:hypothetical protein
VSSPHAQGFEQIAETSAQPAALKKAENLVEKL